MACEEKLIETTIKDIDATFYNLINLGSCFYSKYTNGMHDASLPSHSHFLLRDGSIGNTLVGSHISRPG